ncbi:hypothetical protein QRD43_21480 [Pelomonas sp. APW6]|uniref:Uncharacterized protein n=1 Tax=Roseateles subflavus TaxID=3053353 RepID=A0ABT7LNR0_9BURK|nr:hypothetical protein [Pelomonas sp. APW6]MDL5034490.1 hypothetical protein [Pelomonas sp. APW6]
MSASRVHRAARPDRQRWGGWPLHVWLALCLLLAQGLGQGHRIAHQGARLAASAVLAGAMPAEATATDGWGHAIGSADCQLFDHLAQADQAGAPDHPHALLSRVVECPGAPAAASAALPRPCACARGPPVLA